MTQIILHFCYQKMPNLLSSILFPGYLVFFLDIQLKLGSWKHLLLGCVYFMCDMAHGHHLPSGFLSLVMKCLVGFFLISLNLFVAVKLLFFSLNMHPGAVQVFVRALIRLV